MVSGLQALLPPIIKFLRYIISCRLRVPHHWFLPLDGSLYTKLYIHIQNSSEREVCTPFDLFYNSQSSPFSTHTQHQYGHWNLNLDVQGPVKYTFTSRSHPLTNLQRCNILSFRFCVKAMSYEIRCSS